ncbi:hypothetical protein GW765_03115 [Candidatus Parcubacteria bacterium]|nr:hypothetical protein [Candidatus Parcubacteria bacterium]
MKDSDSKSSNKSILLSSGFAILLVVGAILMVKSSEDGASPVNNVEVVEGVQYVNITARGGYSPSASEAQAGIPTKLNVKTDGTFDCSSFLVINELNYQGTLPQTGETEIDLGAHEPGTTLSGTCSMGMYNFKINFN